MRTKEKVHILLCGFYFQGNTGDDLFMEESVGMLSRYGDVRVTSTETFDKDLLDWCDLLVVGPGSHITPRGLGAYNHVKYVKEQGKKVFFYSLTVEEGQPAFREHLARADMITVRDSESKKVVERNGFRAVLAADPLFKRARRTIGFSFRKWVNEPQGIEELLAAVLDNLSRDYDIFSVPYTTNETDTEGDDVFHQRLIDRMKYKPLTIPYAEAVMKIDLLLGMRLHALINAVNNGKRILAVDYDAKVGRILADLGMGNVAVPYTKIKDIPRIIRENIFSSDNLAQRAKVNEALIARMCADMKGEPAPVMSIAMPTYNREAFLKDAIDSIINQTMTDWELIVIDDGSSDMTAELVASYQDKRIKYFNFGHNGICFSRNMGSLLSRGKIIVVADSDDINLPERLEITWREMERTGADILYASMYFLFEDGRRELVSSYPFSFERLKKANFLYHPTVAYRREVAMACPYDEGIELSEDYHMYLRAAERGFVFHQVEQPLVLYRVHEEQISSERKEDVAKIHDSIAAQNRGRGGVVTGGPLVSVIIPTFNRPGMLSQALASILSQTYRNLEAIVVNDSGEDVADVIASFHDSRVVYMRHEQNRGRSAARNTGLKAAHGTYIAYLDDDDIYYPDHLETLVDFLEKNGGKVAYTDSYRASQTLIAGRYVTVAKDLPYSFDFNIRQLLISNYITINTIMHRKDLLSEAGMFDEALETHEDWDLLIRLSQAADFHHIKMITSEFRMRSDCTNTTYEKQDDFLRTLRVIHERYARLVTDAPLREAQKKFEESFRIEVENIQALAAAEEFEKIFMLRYSGAESSDLADAFTAFWSRYKRQIGNFEETLRHRDARIGDLEEYLRHRDTRVSYLEAQTRNLEEMLHERMAHIASIEEMLRDRMAYVGSLEEMLRSRDTRVSDLEAQTRNLEEMLRDRMAHIGSIEEMLRDRMAYIGNLEAHCANVGGELRQRDEALHAIYTSHGWRLLSLYYRVRDRLFPSNSRRRKVVKFLWRLPNRKSAGKIRLLTTHNVKRGIFCLKNYGLSTFLYKLKEKMRGGAGGVEEGGQLNSPTNPANQLQGTIGGGGDYFSFLFSSNNQRGSNYVPISFPDIPETDIKLIAFYLPQFHPIPENDEWWGKGFTEWMNVARAVPQFTGHYQPRLPGELGFYDLRIPEVQKRQIELAKQYGIYGFCFHFYWFNGKRLLEQPLEQFLANSEMEFPFCINWANENWTRTWDGLHSDILLAQNHSPEDDIAFIECVSRYLRDKRYIRINSKPLLLVYRPALLPEAKGTAKRWREWCRNNGIGEIYLALTHSFEHIDPREIGFDAAIEFAPNTFPLKDVRDQFNIVNDCHKGKIFDYRDALNIAGRYVTPPFKKFRSLCPCWDNEGRKPGRGTVLVNSSPAAYQDWLKMLCDYTVNNFVPEERIIFINAWNEWAEGAYLEPDRRYGYAYLQATADALVSLPKGSSSLPGGWKILVVSHDACRGGSQTVLLNILTWFKMHTFANLRILCLDSGELLSSFRELGDTLVLSEMRNKRIPEGELVRKLMEFCGGAPDLIYCNSVASGREYRLLRSLDTPIIMHFHELEMSIRRYAADCLADVLQHSAHFIAISDAVRDNLVTNHGVDKAKISTVYSSITPDSSIRILSDMEKQKIRDRLGLEKNKFLVFGCGFGMVFRKGADLFIEVARILRNRGFGNFHFYWIGDFDKNEHDSRYGIWADCVTALRKEGLDKYVTFLGIKDKPREFMQGGDAFLLSSREEPVGLVGLEAAECCLPIICFADAGGMPDFVEKDAGFVVPYEDVEAMADKVAVLMNDEALRQQLGARAREKVLSRFTVEHTTPHILSACRKAAQKKPMVSVIVPNYNHARYLRKRLESVFIQTFKDYEVILLDDASTDNSLELLNKYADYADVRILRNEKNSGSPFIQWLRGIDLARADVIWIAESDDICEPHFLETLLPAFRNPEVNLVYANSHVIDEHDRVTGDYENGEYLTSLSQTKWKKSYLVSATDEINDGLGVKDTILNISAVLFRRFEVTEALRKTLEGMRIAGDWYFIVNAIKDGKVQYDARKLNYHRRHSESVIGKTMSEKRLEDFFREFCVVQEFVFGHYALDGNFPVKWESYLRKQWDDFYPGRPFEELQQYYPVNEMREKIVREGDLSGERVFKQDSGDRQAGYRRSGASNIELLREVEDSLPADQDISTVSIKKLLENVGDEFYFWLLTEGHEHITNQALMSLLPTMPDEQIQTNWTGRSGYETLHQAFLAFSLFKKIINNHYKDIRSCRRILDFGCGWGRIIRFFLKDIEADGLCGVDCYKEAIDICRNSNLRCSFETIDVMPPTDLPDNFFDAICLYSVFSHLSEDAHMAWLLEFRRILKPGGVVIATTRPRHFILDCEAARKNKGIKEFQHGAIASFQNVEECLSDYDNGRFCHSPTGGGGVLSRSFYGETAIPKKYVIEHWTKLFSFVDFIYDDEHRSFDQNVIIAKK